VLLSVRIKEPVRCPCCNRHAHPHDVTRYTVRMGDESCLRAEFVCSKCGGHFLSSHSGETWPLGGEAPHLATDEDDSAWEAALDRITTPEGTKGFLNGLSCGIGEAGDDGTPG